jgi:hypothetical protein
MESAHLIILIVIATHQCESNQGRWDITHTLPPEMQNSNIQGKNKIGKKDFCHRASIWRSLGQFLAFLFLGM